MMCMHSYEFVPYESKHIKLEAGSSARIPKRTLYAAETSYFAGSRLTVFLFFWGFGYELVRVDTYVDNVIHL